MKELSENEALSKAERYCSGSEHCTSEVVDKLYAWGMSEHAVARIISHLIKEGYLDDERYCRFFVNDKFAYNKWGRNKIAQALFHKKISKDITSTYLNEINEEDYLSLLQALLYSKKRQVKARDTYDLKNKLLRYGMGKGFEFELVKTVVDNLSEDE